MRYVESDNLNVQSSDKSVQFLVVHPHVLSLFAKELQQDPTNATIIRIKSK